MVEIPIQIKAAYDLGVYLFCRKSVTFHNFIKFYISW